MENRRVTQQDIARKLGLNKSTVSLALRNHPGIADGTRERVHATAQSMGYRPDPALSTLARQRWAGHETGSGAALAYLVDSRMENANQHRRFLPAARERAEARGYRLHDFDLAEYPSLNAISRVLHHRGIRGVLLPQFSWGEGPSILDFPVEHFTVVSLALGWVSAPFHIVTPDWFEATRMVWREVVDRGYRRVGGAVLAHQPAAVDDALRLGASYSAQCDFLAKRERIPLLTTDPYDREGFIKWFERHQPEVVIGFVSRVYDWILSTGCKIPEDVAFAALTVVPTDTPEIWGPLRQSDEIGSTGVDVLIATMQENEWGVPDVQRKLLLEPVIHEGTTLPNRRSQSPVE